MTANEINIALCRAIGVDPADAASVTLRITPGALPMVEVRSFIRQADADALREVVERFELAPRRKGEP